MLLAQNIRPLPRSPQHRLVVVGAVISLHVVVIAAFLSGLASNVLPAPPPGPIVVKVLERPHQRDLPLPMQTLVLEHPIVPPADVPNFEASNTTIHEPTREVPGNTVVNPPPVRVMAAQPIMGTHTTPDYPLLDARLGHEGNVLLRLTIDEWGAVTDAQVERSSGYESLDRAAASWVKAHWLYHPPTRAGDPIPSTAEAMVTFRLAGRQ